MQSQVPGYIISVESQEERTINERGGGTRQQAARGIINFLISERGKPVIKEVKCSPDAAFKYSGSGIVPGQPIQPTQLFIDATEYDVDGNKGISYKLVEAGHEANNRGNFSIAPPSRAPAPATSPAAGNGAVPVGGAR